MRLAGAVSHHECRKRERSALPRKQSYQAENAPLRQHGERDKQEERREQIDDLAGERCVHLSLAGGNR